MIGKATSRPESFPKRVQLEICGLADARSRTPALLKLAVVTSLYILRLLPCLSRPTSTVSASSPRQRRSLTHPPEKVLVITVDGRTLVGTLLSCDQVTNIVLNETVERVIRSEDDSEPSSQVSHGLYLVRGDNITIVGLVEEELVNSIDWEKVRGEVIGSTKHA